MIAPSPLRALAIAVGLAGALVAAACAKSSAPESRSETSPAAASAIEWLPWEASSFARAKEQGKLVVIDVGMEGCTACRWMNEDTYRHPDVIRRIRQNFVAVQVDAEARPDIGERYSAWAWPATIFLLPDGTQVHALRGNRRPNNFIPILDELIAKQRGGTLTPNSVAVVAPPDVTNTTKLRDALDRQLLALYDAERDGFLRSPMKRPVNAPLRVLAWRASTGDEVAAARVLGTAGKYRGLIDPVWGGAFVGALEWRTPIVEKRIGGQAAVLVGVAEAYAATRDAGLIEIAADVDRYVEAFLLAPDGTFFTSQQDAAPRLPSGMDARAYYALDDTSRRVYGTPPVDHAVYTDQNGTLIEAYARLAEVTGDKRFRNRAVRAAKSLLDARLTSGGWFRQTMPGESVEADARMRALPVDERIYLSAQASMGLALVQLYRATLDSALLVTASDVTRALAALDAPDGGFFASTDDGTGALLGRPQPVDDNGKAAVFLIELGTLLRDREVEERGRRALLSLAKRNLDDEGLAVGYVALAAHAAADDLVEVSVVGREPPRALVDAARAASLSPRVFQRVEQPGHYPDFGRSVVFVCTDSACSLPLDDPARIRAAVQRSLQEAR